MRKSTIFWFYVGALLAVTGLPLSLHADGLILEKDEYDYGSDKVSKVRSFKAELSRGQNDSGYRRYFTDASGKRVSIDIRYIAEVVTFPDTNDFKNITSESSLGPLLSKKAELEAVGAKLPQATAHIRGPVAMLESEIKRFRYGERKVNGKWLNAADYERRQLVINGRRYDNAELLSVEDTSVTFQYEDGKIAQISWARLTPSEILSLNGTSQTVHIAADWQKGAEAAARQIALAEQQRIEQWTQEQTRKKLATVAEAHQMEDAARFEEALQLYKKAGAQDEIRRLSYNLAVECEKEGKFAEAEDYFQAAGASAEADRVRQSHRLTEAQIYKQVIPCVVVVCVKNRNQDGHGSGFFVHSGGYVITNNHVIEDMNDISIIDSDGKRHTAKVVASTKTPDLALLKADVADHKVLALGNPSNTQPGDHVVLIGFPIIENLSAIMNQGVISSVDRTMKGNKVFQIDATINHGNSGGPLLNDHGEVIGVTTFGFADFGVDRFNFAIKISEARFLIEKLGLRISAL